MGREARMGLAPATQDRAAPGLTPEAMRDTQNRSNLRTATGLAYIITLLFFGLVFTLVLFGVGPVFDLNSSSSQTAQGAAAQATITVGGMVVEKDVVTATFTSAAIGKAPVLVQYVATSGDTPEKIASGLSGKINGEGELTKAGIKSAVSGALVTILAPPTVDLDQAMKVSKSGGVTETVTPLAIAAATGAGASVGSRQPGPASAGSPARDLVFTLLGVIATGWATIIGYYYGSSSGSAQKTLALAQAATQKNEPSQFELPKEPAVTAVSKSALMREATPQPVTVTGRNLDDVKSVQFSNGTNKLKVTESVHTSSSIGCAVTVVGTDPAGDYNVELLGASGVPIPTTFRVKVPQPEPEVVPVV